MFGYSLFLKVPLFFHYTTAGTDTIVNGLSQTPFTNPLIFR